MHLLKQNGAFFHFSVVESSVFLPGLRSGSLRLHSVILVSVRLLRPYSSEDRVSVPSSFTVSTTKW